MRELDGQDCKDLPGWYFNWAMLTAFPTRHIRSTNGIRNRRILPSRHQKDEIIASLATNDIQFERRSSALHSSIRYLVGRGVFVPSHD